MAAEKSGLVRAVWNGPFYIGPLSRPVSVGDVLLKTLETLWRAILSIVVLLVVGGLGIAAWVRVIEPTFFPALKTQISAIATYDDGSAKLPPAIGEKPFRCSPDYPIRVAFKNNSKTAIGHLDFSIEGRPANRSDNVVEGAAWRQADTIIPAGYTWQSCWAVSVGQGLSPETLDYKVSIWGATEADANAKFQPVPPPANVIPKPTDTDAAIASATPILDNVLQFKDASACDMTPETEKLFQNLMIFDPPKYVGRRGPAVRVAGFPQPLVPSFSRKVDEGEGRNVRDNEATLAIAGTWHGLKVSKIRVRAMEESSFWERQIRFSEPAQRVRDKLNELGFRLPAVGQYREFTGADVVSAGIGVEKIPGGSALYCGSSIYY